MGHCSQPLRRGRLTDPSSRFSIPTVPRSARRWSAETSPNTLKGESVPMPSSNTRIEHDLLGDLAVPADAYYGVQTARALENFQISGLELRLYPNFIKALAMVKLAAARANFDTGGFSQEILSAIESACQEIIDGKL